MLFYGQWPRITKPEKLCCLIRFSILSNSPHLYLGHVHDKYKLDMNKYSLDNDRHIQ